MPSQQGSWNDEQRSHTSIFSSYDLPTIFANWRDFPDRAVLRVESPGERGGQETPRNILLEAILSSLKELLRTGSPPSPWIRIVCDPCDQICGCLAAVLRELRASGGVLTSIYLIQRPWSLVSLVDIANEALVSALCLQRSSLVIYLPFADCAESLGSSAGRAEAPDAERVWREARERLLLDGYPWPISDLTLRTLQTLSPALQLSFIDQAASFAAAGRWTFPASSGAAVISLLSQRIVGLAESRGAPRFSIRDLEKAHSSLLGVHKALGGGPGDIAFCCFASASAEADLTRELSKLLESVKRAKQTGISSTFVVIRKEDERNLSNAQQSLPVMLCLASSSLVPDWLRFLSDSVISALEAGLFDHPKKRLLETSAQFLRTASLRQEANLLSARGKKPARAISAPKP